MHLPPRRLFLSLLIAPRATYEESSGRAIDEISSTSDISCTPNATRQLNEHFQKYLDNRIDIFSFLHHHYFFLKFKRNCFFAQLFYCYFTSVCFYKFCVFYRHTNSYRFTKLSFIYLIFPVVRKNDILK